MKVCFVSGAYLPVNDGIGDYTAKLIDNLQKMDIEVSLVTTDEKEIRDNLNEGQSCRIYPIIKNWNIFGINAILKLIKKERFDIIHLQFPSTRYRKTFSLCLLPLFLRIFFKDIKIVVTLHEFSISYPVNRLRQFFLALCSHRVITIDENDFNKICRILPGGRGKISIIPIGSSIDVCAYDPRDKEIFFENLGLNQETRIVSFFGVIHSNKGIGHLFEAISKLIRGGLPVYLLIISQLDSSRNAYHNNIKELIDSLGIKKSIFWTGYVSPEEVSKYLLLSDICVLPFTDGVTLRRSTLMAALTHSKPVISTRSDSYTPSALIDKENIFLVPINDIQKLTEAIELLCTDNMLRQRIGEAAGCLAEKFSWKKISSEHLDIYKILGGERNGIQSI